MTHSFDFNDPHLALRLSERGATREDVLEAFRNEHQIVPAKKGRKMLVGQVGGRPIRVIFEEPLQGEYFIVTFWWGG